MNEKFLSFRIEKLSSISAAQNQFYHDYRIVAPKYADASRKSENIRLNRSVFFNEMRQNKEPNIIKKYNESQKARIKEKTGRTAQASAEFFNSGILTFSPEMAEDYKSNPDLFQSSLKAFVSDLERNFGINAIYSVIHLDENCPHAHFLFDNIGEDGKSIRRTINPITLTNIQTLAGKHFASMGYKRGQSVNETARKHLSVKESHRIGQMLKYLESEVKEAEMALKSKQEQAEIFQHLAQHIKAKTPEITQLMSWINGGVNYDDLQPNAKAKVNEFMKKTLSTPQSPQTP